MKKSTPLLTLFAILPAVFLLPGTAHAAGLLDTVTNSFKTLEPTWFSRLFTDARDLFTLLVTLELAWLGLTWLLAKRSMEEIVPSLLKKIVTIGFFMAILINAQSWVSDIINSFTQAGSTAGGVSALSPSTILSYGIADAMRILGVTQSSGGGSLWSSFVSLATSVVLPLYMLEMFERLILAAIIFTAFFMIALDMMILLIESYLILGAGVLFLGFGGSRWTAKYVNSYFNYALVVGTKLFVIYLIVGALYTTVIPQINSQMNSITNHLNLSQILPTAALAIAAALIAKKVPEHAGALLGGASSASGSAFMSEIGRVAATAGATGAAVLTGGLAAVGVAGAAGVTSAAGATGSAAGVGGVAATSGAAGVAAPAVSGVAAGVPAPAVSAGASAGGASNGAAGAAKSTASAASNGAAPAGGVSAVKPAPAPSAQSPQSAPTQQSTATAQPATAQSTPDGQGDEQFQPSRGRRSISTATTSPTSSAPPPAQASSPAPASSPTSTTAATNTTPAAATKPATPSSPSPAGSTTAAAAQKPASPSPSSTQPQTQSAQPAPQKQAFNRFVNALKAANAHLSSASNSSVSANHADFSHGSDI